ncbi:hypothetical protein C8Q78DRAFT_1077330 [Trametes maxima]|nr:hypothetical protein C8Q78DRAFT_1077330 [Trametes maxima]
MSQAAESLVEERLTKLLEICDRRKELLREMYHLIQKRDNLGSVITVEQDGEESLQLFLDRFDLEKYPDTGHIENLQEEEVALPVTPPAYSPVLGHGVVQQIANGEAEESPVSPLPGSPLAAKSPTSEEPEILETPQEEVAMDVDSNAAEAPTQETPSLEPPKDTPSRTASREPSPILDTGADKVPSEEPCDASQPLDDVVPTHSPTPAGTRPLSPSLATSTQPSPMPQSADHSSTASVTEASGTREPSSLRVSPPQQRSPSPAPQPVASQDSTVKAEPLDDEPMDVTEAPQATQEPEPLRKRSESPGAPSLSMQQSEDHIMDILEPSQPVSPRLERDEGHYLTVDYSIPRPTVEPNVDFVFDSGVADGLTDLDVTPDEPFGPEPPYPLPPLSLLPLEFSRRGKTSKRERKRDKDRDRGEAKKEEWTPMSLTKWAAVLRANPVHKRLSRATKCLSTRDWSVGMTEVRLIRTFERIELLKDAGRWSFRQIKKQRGVGGLSKTHWDYLMDEMKWMRTDFREERKWKLAVAYSLAHAVVEWHEAGTLEERVRRGICVLWKPPPPEDADMTETSEPELADDPFRASQEGDDTGVDSRETGTPANDSGSDDDSDDEQDKEQRDVLNALEPGTALQDALEQLEHNAQASQSQPGTLDGVALKPKMEEIEDLTALGGESQSRDENAMDVDAPKSEAPEADKPAEPEPAKPAPAEEPHPGLKSTSKNPILGRTGDGDGTHGKPKSKVNQYAPLRDHIIYSDLDKLFIDLDDLDIVKGMSDLSTDDFNPNAPPPPADFSSIFPDLQPYGMLDVAPPNGQEGRKKSDRRGDRDDPNKRAEDTTHSKLVPMSKFMQVKPTLVGTLQPSKHWRDGKWLHIEETPLFADIDVPPARPVEENLCALFEGSKSGGTHPSIIPTPVRSGNANKRSSDVVWTPAEDALLKQVVEKYPGNWSLVAEAFNSSRVTISTDKRSAWDCLERWKEKAAAEARSAVEDESRSATPVAAAIHMTTRGHKRSASQSVAAASGSSSNGSGQSGEPKKRMRHILMHDTLRKAAKRREAVQKSNAAPRTKPTAVHETHGAVTKMERLTPAELSRMKADKEARDAQELLMRRRNDELARQHLLREQAQRSQGLPPNAQQSRQPAVPLTPQAAGANGVPRPPAAVPQAQMVQQIRSQVGISQQQQQQRIAAALAAGGNTRMSPPQLTPAQAAHLRAMAAQGQAAAQGNSQGSNGQVTAQIPAASSASAALSAAAPALSAAHLSPSFTARTASSSPGLPQQSPPLPAASPANAAVARPPSVPGQGVQINPMLHAQNVAQYYLQMQQRGMTPDQLQAMVAQVQQRQAQQYAAAHNQHPPAQQQGQNSQGGGYQHT